MTKCFKTNYLIMALIVFTIPILIPTSNTGKYRPLTIEESELRTNKY